jgi:hypothetical protein
MAALALALDTSVPALFLADAADIELPGAVVSAEDYQGILLYAGDEAPRDGIEELLVALRDIRQILSRPAVARLAKIERVAEEVARAGPSGDRPARLSARGERPWATVPSSPVVDSENIEPWKYFTTGRTGWSRRRRDGTRAVGGPRP